MPYLGIRITLCVCRCYVLSPSPACRSPRRPLGQANLSLNAVDISPQIPTHFLLAGDANTVTLHDIRGRFPLQVMASFCPR